MDATATEKTHRDRSALRIYLGRNRVPLAVALAVLGVGGAGGVPLANRIVSGAQAAERQAVELAKVRSEVDHLKAAQADLKRRQELQANTVDRVDGNVTEICRALKVNCRERPARPE